MSALPFSMSPEVAAHIEQTLFWAQREPDVLFRFVPILQEASNSTCTDENGNVIDHYPGLFFRIGWFSAEDIFDFASYIELDLLGFKVFAAPRTLDLLRGKELLLRKQKVLSLLVAKPDYAMLK